MVAVQQKLWGFEMVMVHAVDEWRSITVAHGNPSVSMTGISMMPLWRAVSWDILVLIVSHAKQPRESRVRWKRCSVKETRLRWEIVFMVAGVWEAVAMNTLVSYVLVRWTSIHHLPCYCSAFDSNSCAFSCHAIFIMSRLAGFCALSSESKDSVTRICATSRTLLES